ncbi:MAG TPA: hypothetical protein EYN38_06530 [Flavobacteriales bacterium]|nr:hypothetical protein [Flavobacteriales bacterium]HIA10595.1 hypothetical protein [Flavobacteriales bacterium]HIO72747.1 hypothetical protein [Flavobacteriales bacterium]
MSSVGLQNFIPLTHSMAPDDFNIWYQGKFDDEFTAVIIELSEFNLENKDDMKKSRKRISYLLAESFQNIVRHRLERKETDKKGSMFGVQHRGKVITIYSSNIVEKETKELLVKNLDKVNRLNKDELKEQYNKILLHGELSEKGGAGLGLIEMARKSGNKLQYKFEDAEDNRYHFKLQLSIGAKDATTEEVESLKIDETIMMHQKLSDNNVVFLFKGDFSRSTIKPMLNFIEGNQTDKIVESKRVFHVSLELMQNICDYGLTKDGSNQGLFAISLCDDGQFVYASNPVTEEAKKTLNAQLASLKDLSTEELNDRFRADLKSNLHSESNNASVGLIDVSRVTKEPLVHEYVERSDGETWYSVGALV